MILDNVASWGDSVTVVGIVVVDLASRIDITHIVSVASVARPNELTTINLYPCIVVRQTFAIASRGYGHLL